MLTLRDYQHDDVLKMLGVLEREHAFFNFNEQRTGKLVEFIALCDHLWTTGKLSTVLIVAPKSTLRNVADEFERWLGWTVGIGVAAYKVDAEGNPNLNQPDVVAINPEVLRKRTWWGFKQPWDLALFDECHRYANRGAAQTKGAMTLARMHKRGTQWVAGCNKVVFASGTPLTNGKPREVWPLLHMANPGLWSSFWKFMCDHSTKDVPRRVTPFGNPCDENSGWSKAGLRKMEQYLGPRACRRLWRDVKGAADDVSIRVIRVDLEANDPEHARAYRELDAEWRTEIAGQSVVTPTTLSRTIGLAQFAACPRISGAPLDGGLVAAISDFAADRPGHVVVWCWHREMVDAVAARLAFERQRLVFEVTGAMGVDARAATIRGWQGCEDGAFLVCTIGSLSEGLDLSIAQTAIVAEESWVPKDNDQAIARILGPNQQAQPEVIIFIAAGTILEDKHKAVGTKRTKSEALMSVIQEARR